MGRDGLMAWTDFRTDPMAAFFAAIYTATHWRTAVGNNHPMLGLPGVSVLTVYPDWMHIKYLGTDKYFLGSVLYLMCHVLLPGLSDGYLLPGVCADGFVCIQFDPTCHLCIYMCIYIYIWPSLHLYGFI